ncbi:MAG: methyltransferase domain-containing protein [Candidatus Levybacteria bacterium]|nr:methyltransferase domain-containing protein [Candidatus Levybacteria bacterium]
MSNYSQSSFDDSDSNANSSWYKVFHLISPKSAVLDVGCSSGNFGTELTARRDCIVDGIEVEPGDAKLAEKNLRNVYVLDVEKDDIGLIKEKYDVIYFGDIIEHLVNPIGTLKRIRPLLKSNGTILFSIPNMAHISVRLALLRGDFEYTQTGLLDKTHIHFYNQREVERVFNEAGYEITNLDFVKKDYPKELLREELNKIGLSPAEKFYNLAAKPDASAFQFVGSAKPDMVKHHKLAEFGPIDMFNNYYENTKLDYEKQIKKLKGDLKSTKKDLEIIQHSAKNAQEELKHKAEHPYRSAAGHLKRKVKSKL